MKIGLIFIMLAINACTPAEGVYNDDTGYATGDAIDPYNNVPTQLLKDLSLIGRDGVEFIIDVDTGDMVADPYTLPDTYSQEVTIQSHVVWKNGMTVNLEVVGERRVTISNLSTANLLSHDPMAGQSMYMVDGDATPHCYNKPDKNKVWLMCMYQNGRGEYVEMNHRENGYHTKYTQHSLAE